jgi:MFS family permease
VTQPPPVRLEGLRLGLRANLAQFCLLVGVNALVGGMVGQERSLLSLLATETFGLAAVSAALTYIVAFGLTKAATNFLAGALADRFGRKPVLVAGWLVGLPVPLLLIWAPSWGWVVAANVLLGVNQGLCWSTTVIMKIDLAGPRRRGLAMGLNEAAGYLAVALTAYLTGVIAARAGLRPEPFYLGLAYAGLGLGLSALLVRETHGHAHLEAQLAEANQNTAPSQPPAAPRHGQLSTRQVVVATSWREPALSACSQAGLVNNLNDGLAWGLLPLLYVRGGLPVAQIGLLAALYPAVWGMGQLFTGPLSDRLGRKPLITAGMLLQALALAGTALAGGFLPWAACAVLLGVGTAMVYPTLLAAISDVAHPSWRATAVGVYRLWRDTGFAVGALLAGLVADLAGLQAAVWVVAALTAASGLVVAGRMYETHRPARSLDGTAAVRDLPGPQTAAGLPVPGRPDRRAVGPPGRAGRGPLLRPVRRR